MHTVIDVLTVILMLLFFIVGWKKGLLLSLMNIIRMLVASAAAVLAGKYLGYWLGAATHRPRIVTIPVAAGMTFIVLFFLFHMAMAEIRARQLYRREKEDIQLSPLSRLGGAAVNSALGLLTLILVLWAADLAWVGLTGNPMPGADRARFTALQRRAVYEAAYFTVPKNGRESQVATMARMISNPARGIAHLESLLEAESVKQLLTDDAFGEALLSGDPEQIRTNSAMQNLIGDKATLRELRALGLLSKNETEEALYQKLSRFGKNEKIRSGIQQLKERDLLRTDKITLLIRDPDFDIIISELVK